MSFHMLTMHLIPEGECNVAGPFASEKTWIFKNAPPGVIGPQTNLKQHAICRTCQISILLPALTYSHLKSWTDRHICGDLSFVFRLRSTWVCWSMCVFVYLPERRCGWGREEGGSVYITSETLFPTSLTR